MREFIETSVSDGHESFFVTYSGELSYGGLPNLRFHNLEAAAARIPGIVNLTGF